MKNRYQSLINHVIPVMSKHDLGFCYCRFWVNSDSMAEWRVERPQIHSPRTQIELAVHLIELR